MEVLCLCRMRQKDGGAAAQRLSSSAIQKHVIAPRQHQANPSSLTSRDKQRCRWCGWEHGQDCIQGNAILVVCGAEAPGPHPSLQFCALQTWRAVAADVALTLPDAKPTATRRPTALRFEAAPFCAACADRRNGSVKQRACRCPESSMIWVDLMNYAFCSVSHAHTCADVQGLCGRAGGLTFSGLSSHVRHVA